MEEKETYTLSFTCPDNYGIVAQVTQTLWEAKGFLLESSQYSDPASATFFMRILFYLPSSNISSIKQQIRVLSERLQMRYSLRSSKEKMPLLLMVSKASHCLNTLLYQWKEAKLPITIAAIVSNHPDLMDLSRFYEVPFYHFPLKDTNKEEQEKKVLALIEKEQIELVVLARYMQILTPAFLQKAGCKVINIHHSFLPSFKGAKPYHQAYERGVKLIGATSHYVTEQLDEGPIIEQDAIRIDHAKSAEQLAAIGKDVESVVLSRAVRYHVEGRVFVNGSKTVVFR
jgi:formyltetrahydrofolate deformylase